jgi:hypothetical protein
MSLVIAHPEALATAAGHLDRVGSVMAAQNAAAAPATTGMTAAAANEVSALTATQFSAQGGIYQAVATQAMALRESLVAILDASAGSYAATEAANTSTAS